MTNAPLVAFAGISKTYGNGTLALDDVSFSIAGGVIHAICGENGAGKSTLMKILFGLEQPSSGAVLLDGKAVAITSPRVAAGQGIGMVHQHFSLVPSLSVTENIVLGQEPRRGAFIDRAAARQRVVDLAQRYNLLVDPDAVVRTLSVAAQQKVEILKALSRDVRVLILDEPTAVLTPPETDELFERLRDLRAAGLTILFISHKLREVRALASHVTVLRAGRLVGDAPLDAIEDDAIARLVMGQAERPKLKRGGRVSGAATVTLADVSLAARDAADRLHDLDLAIHAGEILGVAGVDGSGQRGLVSVLTGRIQPSAGAIAYDGHSIAGLGTAALRQRGLAHLPADRFHDGGSKRMSLVENAIAGAHRLAAFSSGPFLKRRAMEARTVQMIERYNVRAPGPKAPLAALSGGNAQKLIAAREFATEPRFLIADQPTRGIDVAAAAFLHERLSELAEKGCAVLLITADLDELLALSDRIVVLYAGRIVARMENGPDLTPERLGPSMLGLESAA
ncbi:simple sugar transport system ATP-binding protein [Kaistia hirudinis]|uniref:Simple sugar transport system ATP-binding protein n=1 Tax=Kaistia hirudinis TaxID=1293440 RepID=A0A840AWA8_9HYPH|nr:ABC transporter ATP-binding protein [Kaistia hirudinis]MBB3932576.1 simple sugar transport system ATP-binding protein [Kaistia hirudinis]